VVSNRFVENAFVVRGRLGEDGYDQVSILFDQARI